MKIEGKQLELARHILKDRGVLQALNIDFAVSGVTLTAKVLVTNWSDYIKVEKEVLSGTLDNEIRNFHTEPDR